MKNSHRIILAVLCSLCLSLPGISQTDNSTTNLPKDYLSASFHAERRQALRNLMPANSVTVIFSYPEEVFSRDVDYVFHQNPDMYYFSGYNEPNAVLLIFKEMQPDGDSSYNELFFVQHRDPRQESWTGKRLGVEGVKSKLGFKRVYNGEDFGKFNINLRRFNIIYDQLPDTTGNIEKGSLGWLAINFIAQSGVKPMNKNLARDMNMIYQRGNARNLSRLISIYDIGSRINEPAYKNEPLIQELYAKPDSVTLADFKEKFGTHRNSGLIAFAEYTYALRGIKTPEEIVLIKKSVELSSIAHAEAMRAVTPKMSERELEGIMLYVHKKYGAEEEGYGPIVGAGGNGCILHYEDNSLLEVGNQLVLMDVGAMYHGYSADVTRTFPANGKFSEEQKAIYQIVYDAQEAAFKICKPGVSFDSAQRLSEQVVADGLIKLGVIKSAKEMKTYYPHGLSHHLGLDVHDKGNYKNMEENMVITVEPGIYIPAGSDCDKKWWNIGVRIEDDVLIGKEGCILLSGDAPRKWQEIEKTVAEKSVFDAVNFPALK
jgi:Xaa-Pro aminopeptidase